MTSPMVQEPSGAPRPCGAGASVLGEQLGRCSSGSRTADGGGDGNDPLHRHNPDFGSWCGEVECVLRDDDAGARILTQRAAQLVVKNGAPRIMPRLKARGRYDRV